MNRHFGTFACLMIIFVFLFISTVIFHDVATKFVVPKGASNRLRWLNTVQVQAKAESPMSTTATTTTTTTSTKTHPPLPLPPLPPLPPPPVPTTNTTTTTTTHPHINVETKVLLPPPLPPVMDIGKYEQQLAEALRRITILEADTDKLEHQQLAEALRRITILEAEVVHLNQYVQATTVTPFEKQNIVIVIPYRDRAVHYKKIMEHLPSITRENWRIHTILVEQIDKSPFKRAWLMNIGIAEAKKRVGDNKTCVVTHDVDMLADSKVDYGWCDRPTQICSELSCFNGGVPYATSGGGVVQSSLKDWYTINGFTNTAIGWGGEDDDLHHRFRVNHLLTGGHLRRPNKGFGKCHCMHDADHTKRVRDNKGYKEINAKIGRMSAGSNEWKTDGLNSLKYGISEESVDKYGTIHLKVTPNAITVTPFEKQNIVIVIPYRDRAVHYKKIMEHLPSITRENWRIHTILVEQIDKSPFKRAWLMNIGIAEAKKRVGDNKTCVVTHDVDMLADSKVDYGWCDRPTQICSELSCFNGGVPYATSGGGVVQSSLKDWYTINGFTNTAIGWGGEDDDLHHRFRVNHLLTGGHLRRPNKGFGKCHCMHDADHTKRVRDNKGYKEINAKIGRMSAGSNEWKTDGLNSLKYDISEESVDKYGTIHLKVMHTNLSTYQVSVLSHGYEVLGNSTIELKLDGVILNQYQKRGFNFVTIHPITLGVIQEKSFDTYASAADKDSMIHWLKDLHSSLTLCPGCIILGGVDNEGATTKLDAAAYSQLRTSLGVTLTSLCVRCSFAFISKQGGTLFEELIGTSKLQAAYVYVVIDKMRQALPVPTKLITKKQLEYQTIKTTIESSVDAAIENDSLEDIQNVSSNQAEDRLKEAENKLKRS